MKEDKIKLQIADFWQTKIFPIDWNKLPEDVIKAIDPGYFRDILCWNGEINLKTVVYFRKVKKFRKDIKQFEKEDVIFGV